MEDLRPVIMEVAVTPASQKSIRLTKLHREKTCSSPYIPIPGYAKHSHPACAPCMGDPDDRYSRFNYIDSGIYLSLLQHHQAELLKEVTSMPTTSLDHVFSNMALEILDTEIQKAAQESIEEKNLHDEIVKPTSGFYQGQVPHPSFAFTNEAPASTTGTEDTRNDSSHPTSPSSPKGSCNKLQKLSGSLFLDEATTIQFYQSSDGQLVFLNGFNVTCLLSDFSRSKPESSDSMTYALPNFVEGRILEVEHKNLTPELRKRLPCLSHLPLFTDISFVELDLNHILTDRTKQSFKGDLAKRRKKRQSKVKAEKRADRAAQKEETELINERRARLQRIDPEDAFFRQHVVPEEPALTAEDFVVSIGGDVVYEQTTIPVDHNEEGLSFSSAVRRDNGLVVSSTEAFPTLGTARSIPPAISTNNKAGRWDTTASSAPGKKQGGGKKKGGKGKLLFSTGGQRAAGY